MEEYKSLCAKIPVTLHGKVREEQEKSNLTLNQYMELLLTEYYHMKEGKRMEKETRTLAVQISEELMSRVKVYLKTTGKSQKAFITEIIEKALAEIEE